MRHSRVEVILQNYIRNNPANLSKTGNGGDDPAYW